MSGVLNLVVDNLQCLVSQEELKSQYENSFVYEELQAQIDAFYAEGANWNLPIKISIQYITKKAKGATAEELEEFLVDSQRRNATGLSYPDRLMKIY